MIKYDFTPLFNYLKENNITQDTLVREQVVAEGALNRLKNGDIILSSTIARIMDFLKITDLNKVVKVIWVEDDKDTSKLTPNSCKYFQCFPKKSIAHKPFMRARAKYLMDEALKEEYENH